MANVGGIIVIVVLVAILLLVIGLSVYQYYGWNNCTKTESSYCYQIQCLNDGIKPCGNFAKRPGPRPNTWYCSSAPNTLVNDQGIPT